jgi:hypothetical protein
MKTFALIKLESKSNLLYLPAARIRRWFVMKFMRFKVLPLFMLLMRLLRTCSKRMDLNEPRKNFSEAIKKSHNKKEVSERRFYAPDVTKLPCQMSANDL